MTRALVLAAVFVLAVPARADRLVLESGGTIDTDHWWIEGDTLHYDSPAGTIGIPKGLLVRVEKGPGPAPTSPTPKSPASTPSLAPAAKRLLELNAWVDEGNEALRRLDWEAASDVLGRALRAAPERTDIRVGFAAAEIKLGRDASALAAILDGLGRSPQEAALHELLGDLRDREERVDDALAAWREAFRLDPNDRLREKIELGEREQAAGREYAYSASPHFTLRYDEEGDPGPAAEIADVLEEGYRELSGLFRHAPPQPITVLLYPTRAFRDVTGTPENVGGLYDGKIRVPLGGLTRVDPRARAVLRHELAHAVIYSKTRGNAPRWLHEGLAQRVEERPPATDAERQTVRRHMAGLSDPSGWESRGFSYPVALALVRFLEEDRGLSALVDVLARLGEGKSEDEALRDVYGEGYGPICRRFAEAVAGGEIR